jgi:hypothetical protein
MDEHHVEVRCVRQLATRERAHTDDGDAELWPQDGLVSDYSARAVGLPGTVAPLLTTRSFPVTHSIFISELNQLPWETGMTWNPDVLTSVAEFIDSVR